MVVGRRAGLDDFLQDGVGFADGETGDGGVFAEAKGGGCFFVAGWGRTTTGERVRDHGTVGGGVRAGHGGRCERRWRMAERSVYAHGEDRDALIVVVVVQPAVGGCLRSF